MIIVRSMITTRQGGGPSWILVEGLVGKSPIGLLIAITYPDGHTVRFRFPDE